VILVRWKARLALLLLAAVPALTGLPLGTVTAEILPGVGWSAVAYFAAANLLLAGAVGGRRYGTLVAVGALITLPVVLGGGIVAYLLYRAPWVVSAAPPTYSGHYVRLALNMLTVIPLALGIMAVLPFQRLEMQVLSRQTGVTVLQKNLLMILRVFNHIVFAVVPGMLEVMREENWQQRVLTIPERPRGLPRRVADGAGAGLRAMTQVAVNGICAAVQYISLWAVEIARLPTRRVKKP
jgi:hypothetical protein